MSVLDICDSCKKQRKTVVLAIAVTSDMWSCGESYILCKKCLESKQLVDILTSLGESVRAAFRSIP